MTNDIIKYIVARMRTKKTRVHMNKITGIEAISFDADETVLTHLECRKKY